MSVGYRRVVRPVLFRSAGGDPEAVHEATLDAVADVNREPTLTKLMPWILSRPDAPVDLFGVRFPGVCGLAAGMDKNGVGLRTWGRMGFGHVELGTVTPRPQPGNPAPRLFRLPSSQAVINRMGFNNEGVAALAVRIREARRDQVLSIPVGVSIGKNRDTDVADATADYLACLDELDGLADYIAVNISSPNTPGLRGLQDAEPLRELLQALVARAAELGAAGNRSPVPILVKMAPDLDDDAIAELVSVATEAGISGFIATNTTLARDGLHLRDIVVSSEAGGLSGAPLTTRAREVVSIVRQHTDLPVIGVGGIMTPDDAMAMLDAGADLVQIYTGYIYAGPALVSGINSAAGRRARG